MWKLVALVQEQLPNSAHRARVHLLERLFVLEALETRADPGTLRSIRAVQHLVRRCDPLMDA
jgi:hypothetical protein